MRDALVRAVIISPALVVFWIAVEWRSRTVGGARLICRLRGHRWRVVWGFPDEPLIERVVIGAFCDRCNLAEPRPRFRELLNEVLTADGKTPKERKP